MNAASAKVAYDIYRPNIVVMNSIVSSAASGLLIVFTDQYYNGIQDKEIIMETQLLFYYNVHQLCGGVLAGLISITGSCANVSLFAAAIIGIVGSVIYTQTRKIRYRFEIDDPLDISEIHGFCGIWSIIATGLFDVDKGLLYTGNHDFLSIQLVGILAYTFWSCILTFIFFYTLKINNMHRIQAIYEIIGLDFL